MIVNTSEGVKHIENKWWSQGTSVRGERFLQGPFNKRKDAVKDFCSAYWCGMSKEDRRAMQFKKLLEGNAVTFPDKEFWDSTGSGTPDAVELAERHIKDNFEHDSYLYTTGGDDSLGSVYQIHLQRPVRDSEPCKGIGQ